MDRAEALLASVANCRRAFSFRSNTSPMENQGPPTKRSNTILWIVVLVAIVALVIDLIDGYTPKTLTSLGLLIGLGAVLGGRLTGMRGFTWLSIAGFLVCIGSAVYRAALHQGWI